MLPPELREVSALVALDERTLACLSVRSLIEQAERSGLVLPAMTSPKGSPAPS